MIAQRICICSIVSKSSTVSRNLTQQYSVHLQLTRVSRYADMEAKLPDMLHTLFRISASQSEVEMGMCFPFLSERSHTRKSGLLDRAS